MRKCQKDVLKSRKQKEEGISLTFAPMLAVLRKKEGKKVKMGPVDPPRFRATQIEHSGAI